MSKVTFAGFSRFSKLGQGNFAYRLTKTQFPTATKAWLNLEILCSPLIGNYGQQNNCRKAAFNLF
jgi:hypothetical protein